MATSKTNQPQRGVTVRRIAEEAGVSPTTVSLVLNGRGAKHRIAEPTIARVKDAARLLQYTPNDLARSLRKQSTGAIGVVFPHLLNDWAHHVMAGVSSVFDTANLVPLIVAHRGQLEREEAELNMLVRRRVDGVLCNPTHGDVERYRFVERQGVPLVFLGDAPDDFESPAFTAWDPEAVATPVRHLLSCGASRVVYLGFSDPRRVTRMRRDVFVRCVREAGTDPDVSLMPILEQGQPINGVMSELFGASRSRPDAIFTLYDDVAMQAIDWLQDHEFRVPADVMVATMGNSKIGGPRGYGLTTMRAPVVDEGRAAADLLLARLRGETPPPGGVLVAGGELVIGRTTRGGPA
ncbi:MAG: LacI family DNA-binding transcriptional regulator [Planctomycetota bacterium]